MKCGSLTSTNYTKGCVIMKDKKNKTKLLAAITAGAAVIAVAGGAMRAVKVSERKNALNIMAGLADQRVQMIERFIADEKKTLTEYADAPELRKMLADQKDSKAYEAAQTFTERYAEQIDDLECIYASEPSTLVRVHNDKKFVGMITRTNPDSVNELMQAMQDAEDGIYDAGIIRSPASRIPIVSLYKGISDDDDNNIGFAGLAIIADSLFRNDIPSLKGIECASYSIIRADLHNYLCKGDSVISDWEVKNDSILSLCSELSGTDAPAKGNIAYKDESDRYIAAYSYMPAYSILVMAEGKIK